MLNHKNRPKFDRIIDTSLERYFRSRNVAKTKSAATKDFKRYNWEVPEERIYDSETHKVVKAENHALSPFAQLNTASNPEKNFIDYLEENSAYIDWWYKNGDHGKHHFAIEYSKGDDRAKDLFYADFVIRMKNGHVYLFDTKSIDSDSFAPEKHNALLAYIKKYSTNEVPLFGGVIIQDGENWLYSPQLIENTTDTLKWICFYPQNA